MLSNLFRRHLIRSSYNFCFFAASYVSCCQDCFCAARVFILKMGSSSQEDMPSTCTVDRRNDQAHSAPPAYCLSSNGSGGRTFSWPTHCVLAWTRWSHAQKEYCIWMSWRRKSEEKIARLKAGKSLGNRVIRELAVSRKHRV